jgi:hypothetical protein
MQSLLLQTMTAVLLLTCPTTAQNGTDNPGTKRGISWIGTKSSATDNSIFASGNTPLTWYKSWGAGPIQDQSFTKLDFAPMIHSLENLDQDIRIIGGLRYENILTFNEPDGATSGGGTNIEPEDAAEAWAKIVELRQGNNGKKISLPATTGSPNGLEWLQKFNESCWDMYEDTGCEFDFVAAHWYGAFEGLASWLGTLHETYPDKDLWVTEMALPQPATKEEVLGMMNQSLAFLDSTDWVARYAWFGAFREDEANDWTGDAVALLDDDGDLTELGALYMGGEARGFEAGDGSGGGGGSEGSAVSMRSGWWSLLLTSIVFVALI